MKALTAPIRWGIIGCGDVTELKSGPAFNKVADSQLVAVMRRNGDKAADYARRHGVPRWYDDARALVNDPEVNAIYVATPPDAHLDGALLAAAAGKPAYVEKPMARHTPECDRMLAAFADADLPLFVAYYRRTLPRFVALKQLLDDHALGPVNHVHLRYSRPAPAADAPLPWRMDAAVSGGSEFVDLASHAFDLCDHLFGPLEGVAGHASRATATPSGVEDTVAFSFRTPSGALGTGVWNFAAPTHEDLIEVSGPRGRVTCSIFGNEPLILTRDGVSEELTHPNPTHVQQPLIQTVVDALLGRGTCPSTGVSARRTSAAMDQILSAYYGGRDDAFWDRPDTWAGAPR